MNSNCEYNPKTHNDSTLIEVLSSLKSKVTKISKENFLYSVIQAYH